MLAMNGSSSSSVHHYCTSRLLQQSHHFVGIGRRKNNNSTFITTTTLRWTTVPPPQRLQLLHSSSTRTATQQLYSPTSSSLMMKLVVYNKHHNNNLNVFPLLLGSSSSRQLHSWLRLHNNNNYASVFSNWIWRDQKIPKGFENFFPRGTKPLPKSSKTGSSASKEGTKSGNGGGGSSNNNNNSNKKSSTNEKSKSQSTEKTNTSSQGGSGGNGFFNENLTKAASIALGLFIVGRYMAEKGIGLRNNGREITWMDFYHLLEDPKQQIEKIVVVNKQMARVTIRPVSPELAESSSSLSSSGGNSSLNYDWDGASASSHHTDSAAHPTEAHMDLGHDITMHGSSNIRSSSSSSKNRVYHFYISTVEHFEEKLEHAQQELNIAPRDWIFVEYVDEMNWSVELVRLLPVLAMGVIGFFMYRQFSSRFGAGGPGSGGDGGGSRNIFSIGKSNAKKINKEEINVTFADVAGCDQAKLEIKEFVDFLADSSKFTKLGAKIPKGALLCGPPGTGKTLLAKAVAGEAGVPFFSISGSDFLEMFVGVGPSRVRDLFKEARTHAPCIVFIDEIDAVGRRRGRGGFGGGNDERENTLNQLLVEMDGFTPTTGIVVLAGTNRVDILDEALTRAGRFDRQIQVDKPDLIGRRDIFKVHLRGITVDGEIDDYAGRLAGLCPGFSGADIANICNEAAIVAARRKGETVIMEDFEKAMDRVIGGMESNKIMSKEERSIVAFHEAGHAVAGWFLEHADPLMKVTIIPRSSGALGFAQYLPREVYLRTQDQIMDIVCMALAGRASEEVFFGRVTTGASDDLRRVTQLVYMMIQDYGMNSKIGQLAYPRKESNSPGDKPYSDATAEYMDDEARRIVDDAYQRTVQLIREKKQAVEQVANLLLDKETITHDDLIDLIGPRPFAGDSQYDEFISSRRKVNEDAIKDEEEEKVPTEDSSSTTVSGDLTPGLALRSYL